MTELSVIIPIYNVEKYLRQCIDSVICQKLNNTEIILVDDGSSDGSPKICDEYSENYNFVKVIHKKNGGLSSARNAGIEASHGKYIMFMDSDDWWNENVAVGDMLDYVNKRPEVEMFLFSSLDYIEGKGYFKRAEHERLNNIRTDCVDHYYADLLANGNLEVSASTKIIKRDFLISHDLFFREGMVCEDSEWIIRLLRVLERVEIICQPLYICRLGRTDSITNTVGKKNLKDMLSIIELSISHYSQAETESARKALEYCYCAYLWFCALGLSYSLQKQDFSDLKPILKKTSVVCEYSCSRKTAMAYRVYKFFGIGTARFVLGSYLKLKHRFNINKQKQERK